MEPFTTLDVVRYHDLIKHYSDYRNSGHGIISEALVNNIIKKFKDQGAKDTLKYFGAWLHTGFTFKPNVQTAKIDIPFKTVQGIWQENEYMWFRDTFQSHLVYTKIVKWLFGGFKTRTLSNAKELFIVFAEILRQKFGYDEHLMCVLDDFVKRLNLQ